jgi:hypothetical protein
MNSIITKQSYQRIDNAGYWIETVELSPSIIPLENGEFKVDFGLTEDLIIADLPPSNDCRWDGLQWVEPEAITPERPDFIVVRQIDDEGFYLTDVIIEPTLVDNVWIHPGVDSPDYIIGAVPGGFYKPRYVNGRWAEGATKQEIKAVQPPNWLQFINDFSASDLDEMIAQPENLANVLRLNRVFGMYPHLDGKAICDAWNQCLSNFATAPNSDQRRTLIKITEANNLPVTIDANSRMVING